MVSRSVSRKITGFSLVEVLAAVGLLGLLSVPLFSMFSKASVMSARAGESQIAASLGARTMDLLLSAEFRSLAARVGPERSLDFSQVCEKGEVSPVKSHGILIDGCTYTGTCSISPLGPGGLTLEVTLRWERAGKGGPKTGTIKITRIVTDPHAWSLLRPAPGGGTP